MLGVVNTNDITEIKSGNNGQKKKMYELFCSERVFKIEQFLSSVKVHVHRPQGPNTAFKVKSEFRHS